MFQVMDSILLNCQRKLLEYLENFKQEEKGASDIVAIMVIIVVIIAIAAIFKEQLTNAVTKVFEKLTNFIDTTN